MKQTAISPTALYYGWEPWTPALMFNRTLSGRPFIDDRFATMACIHFPFSMGAKTANGFPQVVMLNDVVHFKPTLGYIMFWPFTVAEMAAHLEVSTPTALKHVKALAELHVVRITKRRPMAYVFNPNMHEWEVDLNIECEPPDGIKWPVWTLENDIDPEDGERVLPVVTFKGWWNDPHEIKTWDELIIPAD
jgi:hypothetical protein